MKRGVGDAEENTRPTKKHRHAENSSPSLIAQMRNTLPWTFGTPKHHRDNASVPDIEDHNDKKTYISQPPILSLPHDVLADIMAHATSQTHAFAPNTSAVCRQLQKATDIFRFKRYNEQNGTNLPPVGGHVMNPAIETQEKEIQYLLEHEAEILIKTNNSPEVKACFDSLKSLRSTHNNHRLFFIRDEILNRLNTTIIEVKIKISNSEKLSCKDFHLTRFPGLIITKHLAFFKALQRLNLDNNQLQSLPPQIGQLVALQWLFLRNNQLQSLPHETGELVALKGLDLMNNQLNSLPPEIGQLAALEALFLNNNLLQSLPYNLSEDILFESSCSINITKDQALASQKKPSHLRKIK